MERNDMREKRDKKLEYWTCKYCGRRYSFEDLESQQYIEHTKVGDVVECPKCETEQFVEK